jgi:hypothetical protein
VKQIIDNYGYHETKNVKKKRSKKIINNSPWKT